MSTNNSNYVKIYQEQYLDYQINKIADKIRTDYEQEYKDITPTPHLVCLCVLNRLILKIIKS